MSPDSMRLQLSVCEVDIDQGVVFRGDETVELTNQELDLLVYLMKHPNQVFSRDHLLREVWGQQNPGLTRAVDMTVRRLRKKVEANSKRPHHIRTVRSAGYRFVGDVKASPTPPHAKSSDPFATPPEDGMADTGTRLPMTFGRYLLVDLLGEGGFARVYRAELHGPSGFNKTVAVKVMKVTTTERAAELAHEGRLGGLLKHRNVVDTYELGAVSGRTFVAMEWVDGLSLRELVRAATPPPSVVVEVGLEICRGLAYAHGLRVSDGALGLVHLDLKPANVLVGWDGSVKVADFGIARLTRLQDDGTPRTMGTPAYMSPEQLLGQAVDARADVFSLGVVLYEMVVGCRLFADTGAAPGQKRVTAMEEALTGDWRVAVDQRIRGLGAVIEGCLRMNLAERTSSVQEVTHGLRALRETLPEGPSLEHWLADALESRERQVVSDAIGWARVTPTAEETLPWGVLDDADGQDDAEQEPFENCLAHLTQSKRGSAAAKALARVEASMASLTGEIFTRAQTQLESALERAGLSRVIAGKSPTLVLDVRKGVCFVGGREPLRFRPDSIPARLFFAIVMQGEAQSAEQLYRSVWEEPFRDPSSIHSLRMEVMRLQETLTTRGLSIERGPTGRFALTGGFGVVCWSTGQTAEAEEHATPARTNLLAEPNLFVGRETDLEALGRLVDNGKRMVTILGPPGTGKTRLMKRFGQQALQQDNEARAWFCDLTETRTERGILLAVGRVLGVRLGAKGAGQEKLVERIGDALARQSRTLLLLDNAEQVVDELVGALGAWWEQAPGVRFIVTSRLPLRLAMEQRMPLAPLAVPEATAISGEMEDNPAVALFVDRAKAVQPGFALDSSNVGAVSELVRELDGLPLAIELAAARAQMFPPETQLAQISKRFRLLARPASSGPRRQATLLGALDWSWELLQPWEQTALAQCSVFREGFDWQAVEAVVDLSAFPDAPWSVDVVQMLLEHSLLVSSQTPFGVRLSMLRSVAAYAEKRLSEVGPEARNDAESRHAAHYGTYGTQEFVDSTKRTGGKSRRMKLNVELANLIVATERSVANKWSEEAGPCCRAAVNVIDITGPYALGLSLLDSVLGLLTQESPEFLSLINAKGNFLNMTGRLEEACESFEIWLEAAKETGDPVEQGYALSGQIPTLNNLGLYDKAVSTGEEALKIFRQANLPTEEARVLVNMGVTERRRGHDQRAVGLYQNALDLFREVGDLVSASVVLGNLGNTYAMADRLEEAEDCYAQALAIHREVGNYGGEGRLTLNLARVKKYQGLRDEAQTLWHKALNILVETGQLYWQLQVHMELAKAHREDSQWDESATSHRRGLTIAREINDRDAQAVNLCGLGLVSREQGQLDEAKSMFSQAMEAAKTLEDPYQSGRIHNALGDLALKSDDRVKAREHYEQARTLHQESQHRPNYTRVLMNLGSLALKEGDEEQAVAHWIGAIRSLSKMERRLLGRNLLRDIKSLRDGLTPRLQDALRPHIEEIETLYA